MRKTSDVKAFFDSGFEALIYCALRTAKKLKRPNYKSIETYFQIDGLSDDSEAHHPSSV